jgi:hypothetical protein
MTQDQLVLRLFMHRVVGVLTPPLHVPVWAPTRYLLFRNILSAAVSSRQRTFVSRNVKWSRAAGISVENAAGSCNFPLNPMCCQGFVTQHQTAFHIGDGVESRVYQWPGQLEAKIRYDKAAVRREMVK